MRQIITILILITLIGCKPNSSNNIHGKYLGFWAETIWVININSNNSFEISSDGHFGNSKTNGKFTFQNDTLTLFLDSSSSIAKYTDHEKFLIKNGCLIDIESRYDYCKTRPDEWASDKRAINYPQIPYDSNKNQPIVNQMLQMAIDQIRIESQLDSTIFLKEYYEIKDENNFKLTRFGKKIQLLSEDEIKQRRITNYLAIEDLTLGQKSSFIILRNETFNSTITDFRKRNSNWELIK